MIKERPPLIAYCDSCGQFIGEYYTREEAQEDLRTHMIWVPHWRNLDDNP